MNKPFRFNEQLMNVSRKKPQKRKGSGPVSLIEVEAGNIGARGDAIVSGPVYVPGLLPGERARINVKGERGQIVERLSTSSQRVEPPCPIFETCGGCSLQHWHLDAYKDWKRSLVVTALQRAGLDAEVRPLFHAHGEGRRRAVFHAKRAGRHLVFGFAARSSHHIADLKDCLVAEPLIRRAIPALRRLAEELVPDKGQLDIAVTASDSGLDIACRWPSGIKLDHRLTAAEMAAKEGWARISLNGEPAAERTRPIVKIGKARTVIPAGGFLQATRAGEARLAEQVMAAAEGATRAIDLYAGSGTFALRLAEIIPVLAVEGDNDAVNALTETVKKTQGLKPVEVLNRDLAREPLGHRELAGAGLVVIDPPRNGAREQMEELAMSKVPVIVSISCNPATFARDAAILIEGGYEMSPVTPIDQFMWTGHVECMSVFVLKHGAAPDSGLG